MKLRKRLRMELFRPCGGKECAIVHIFLFKMDKLYNDSLFYIKITYKLPETDSLESRDMLESECKRKKICRITLHRRISLQNFTWILHLYDFIFYIGRVLS